MNTNKIIYLLQDKKLPVENTNKNRCHEIADFKNTWNTISQSQKMEENRDLSSQKLSSIMAIKK